MKRLFFILAACTMVATGCKGGGKSPASGEAAGNAENTEITETATGTKATPAEEGFTFDELFKIFSCFGDNIMSGVFAPQRVKDSAKIESILVWRE